MKLLDQDKSDMFTEIGGHKLKVLTRAFVAKILEPVPLIPICHQQIRRNMNFITEVTLELTFDSEYNLIWSCNHRRRHHKSITLF